MKKITALFLSALMMITVVSAALVGLADTDIPTKEDNNVVFRLHDPRYMKNGEVFYHDENNSSVTPIVNSERALIPLRSVSEAFGADVSFDSSNDSAVINVDGKKIIFPVNKESFLIDGKEYALDTETIIKDNRAMVPLRALCEDALGLTVEFSDGYIVVYPNNKSEEAKSALTLAKETLGTLKYYASHEEIKNFLDSEFAQLYNEKQSYRYTTAKTEAVESEVMFDTAVEEAAVAEDTSASNSAAGGSSFSETNIQTEGVDEADIIKTDGEYIYYLSYDNIYIIEAFEDGDMELASVIERPENVYFNDMYVDGDRLAILGNSHFREQRNTDRGMYYMHTNFSGAYIYDISDRYDPVLAKSSEIEGYTVDTRKIGDLIYIITQKHVYDISGDVEEYIPVYRDSVSTGGDIELLEANKIAIMPEVSENSYLNFAVIDIADDSEANLESVFGGGSQIYMNTDSLYIASYEYDRETYESDTRITYFDLEGKSVIPQGSVILDGSIINQFAMDEYNGYFRVVTTDYSGENGSNLYIIDKETMDVTGSITEIAVDERVYSARFDGDTAYIVTFKQVDPLFVVDVSDPYDPYITGKVKVPGYSTYLHPIGNDLLLGIGRDTKETYIINDDGDEEAVGIMDDGIKLSLFKIEDGSPEEVDTIKVPDSRNAYTNATYNHRALMVDASRLNFGFCVESYANGRSEYYAMVYHVDGEELVEEAQLYSGDEYVYIGENRLCWINDIIYHISNGCVFSYDYNGYDHLDTLKIKEK